MASGFGIGMNTGLFDDDEVIELFKAGEMLDYGDIADRLDIDLQTAVVICRRLEEQGIIEAADIENGRKRRHERLA